MANRTASAHAEPRYTHADRLDALCTACRLADGRPHAHPYDHLGAHGIDCTCDCHAHEAQQVVLEGEEWDLAALVEQQTVGVRGARGPPVALAA